MKDKDAVLMALIAAAEMPEPLEQGVTLLVGGFLVSGQIISVAHYLHHNTAIQGVENLIAASNVDTNPVGVPNYIHLKNARFFTASGQSVPSHEGVYWRGSIGAVAGFTFGLIELD